MIINNFSSFVKRMFNNATFQEIPLPSSDNIDYATQIYEIYADIYGNKVVDIMCYIKKPYFKMGFENFGNMKRIIQRENGFFDLLLN